MYFLPNLGKESRKHLRDSLSIVQVEMVKLQEDWTQV